MTQTAPHLLTTSARVKGTAVITVDDHKVGKIEEVAIDKRTGAIAYAILGGGGVFGVGEHYRPLAWSDLRYDVERKAFALPLTRAEVEAIAPLADSDMAGWTETKSAVFI